jgi:hypothetical protein
MESKTISSEMKTRRKKGEKMNWCLRGSAEEEMVCVVFSLTNHFWIVTETKVSLVREAFSMEAT